jgi:hypothetical protein
MNRSGGLWMVDERPIDADVATRRTVAGCHRNLGRKVTLAACGDSAREEVMDGIIYLVGLIVIVMAILSFVGLR